jgi:uncharacterized membrane protein YqaE (UPF0057 family)
MQVERLLLCLLAPPLAMIDKGANEVILVAFFTVLGWVPGVLIALGITTADWHAQREQAKRAATLDDMQRSIQQHDQLVNLPATHRSGEARYQLAQRAEAIRQRQEQAERESTP